MALAAFTEVCHQPDLDLNPDPYHNPDSDLNPRLTPCAPWQAYVQQGKDKRAALAALAASTAAQATMLLYALCFMLYAYALCFMLAPPSTPCLLPDPPPFPPACLCPGD